MSAAVTKTGALLGVLAIAGFASPPSQTSPADPPSQTSPAEPPPQAATDEPTPTSAEAEAEVHGPTAIERVLPCGLRVIVAQDTTLPVAAIVLAIETGSEDDPTDQPGLVHALAFHLQQGNRELTPGGAAAIVHDAGGVTSLAVGPAQVRYESLLPISRIDRALWAEAQRLRAPTVNEELWAETLRWARRDPARPWGAPREILAAVHRTPGLAHPGRANGGELDTMTTRAVASALADRFGYARATLTVVAPLPAAEVWQKVARAFADLPSSARHVRSRRNDPVVGSAPRPVAHPDGDGELFAWAVDPSPAALARATVLCRTLNRQGRGEGEPTRARVRCHLDEDPRRAAIVVRATGSDDPLALVRGRLARIFDAKELTLVERQREAVLAREHYDLRSPLPLARRLAQSEEPPTGATTEGERAIDALTGLHVLRTPMTFDDTGEFGLRNAVRVVAPQEPTP